jgi:hypothetical protein
MKVLMLILGGGDEIYETLRSFWSQYMHSSDEIEAYFYRSDMDLSGNYEIRGDTVYVKCPENLWSVVKKLQMALQAFESRLYEFDYICRPNLSSFFIFDRYLKAIENLPRKKMCYAVCNTHPFDFPSGCGFTVTPDIAIEYMFNAPPIGCIGGDDVSMGELLTKMKIRITPAPRIDITLDRHWPLLDKLETDTQQFHVRIKHEINRYQNDLTIWKKLLKQIYTDN